MEAFSKREKEGARVDWVKERRDVKFERERRDIKWKKRVLMKEIWRKKEGERRERTIKKIESSK